MHSMTRKKMVNLIWPFFLICIEIIQQNARMFSTIRKYSRMSVEKALTRESMYQIVNNKLQGKAISYLEFGVWKGESIKLWASYNININSRFYGFDSFNGLPEVWEHGLGRTTDKNEFDLKGIIPNMVDSRISLIKGWFQNTLNQFLQTTNFVHPFVVHIDSDLYSSALYVLCSLNSMLKPGDIIIFDEYTSPVNEYLAWENYKLAFMRKADCIAMADHWSQVAFILK